MISQLPDDMDKNIEEIAKIEKLDKSSVIKRFLNKGIVQWKEEFALKMYQEGKFSLGKAAQGASMTIWTFLDKLAEKRISLNYSIEDLKNDIETIDKL